GHVQVGIHPRPEDRDTTELVELGRMGIVVEGAGDKHVKAGIARLPRRRDEVGARYRAEFGADEDAGATFPSALHVFASGTDVMAGPADEAGKGDPVLLVGLLDAGCFQVLKDHAGEIALGCWSVMALTGAGLSHT